MKLFNSICLVSLAVVEVVGGSSNLRQQQQQHMQQQQRGLLAPEQCPVGADGCSLPEGLEQYHLFVPACNVHDICYSCNNYPGWEGVTKEYCDWKFLEKMQGQCHSFWSGWWQGFDLAHCLNVASLYHSSVALFGSDGFDVNPGDRPHLISDGCAYLPDAPEINNARGNGFLPSDAGCPCEGTSCDYW